jgi:hypothetical protein
MWEETYSQFCEELIDEFLPGILRFSNFIRSGREKNQKAGTLRMFQCHNDLRSESITGNMNKF